jgi:hypothetical protein
MPGQPATWSSGGDGETHRVHISGSDSGREPGDRRVRLKLVKRPVVKLVEPVAFSVQHSRGVGQ